MLRPTRTLVDIAALVANAWMWLSIYESFTRSGLWLILSRTVDGASSLPAELAVLVMCVLIGWLTLAAACWTIWRLAFRARLSPDFPVARLRLRR
ncbi:MAG TPA: hypothetical protein VLX92_27270 [Kofleriaceae bacterium]|nr:hypothetical protein [Kofleriaceae bacterium]